MHLSGVRPSVQSGCSSARLLLWARRSGYTDKLLQGRRSAAAALQQMRAVPRCQLT